MSGMSALVEPVTALPRRPVGRVVFRQQWTDLTFLHWAVPPEQVTAHLPQGVRADTLDGVSYVGLVPFVMRRVAAWGGPPLPYLGTFCETNVRLYSVDGQGRRGVVFVSLDASRLLPVLAARLGPRLPYQWSGMRCSQRGDRIAYSCCRRWPGPRGTSSLVRVRIGDPVRPGALEHFVTARWGLHLRDRSGRTRYWPNAHERWPLHAASVEHLDDQLLAAAGFGELTSRPPDSVLYSPGVHAVFGPRLPPA
jgi:uncharacterized protein